MANGGDEVFGALRKAAARDTAVTSVGKDACAGKDICYIVVTQQHDPDGGAEGLIYDRTGIVCVNVCAFVEGHRRRVS